MRLLWAKSARLAFAQERDKKYERYRKSVTKIAEKLRALEASLVEQKASRDKKVEQLIKEIGELRIEVGHRNEQIDEQEQLIAAKDHEISAKAKSISEFEQATTDVEALKRNITLAWAKK